MNNELCAYNLNYIKSIKCNDEMCSIKIANTQTSNGRINSKNIDDTYICEKKDECYNVIKELIK